MVEIFPRLSVLCAWRYQLTTTELCCLSEHLSAMKLGIMPEFLIWLIGTWVLWTQVLSLSQRVETVDSTLSFSSFKHHLYTENCIENNCLFCQELKIQCILKLGSPPFWLILLFSFPADLDDLRTSYQKVMLIQFYLWGAKVVS